MTRPKTLLELSGLNPAPQALGTSAVLMIDAQLEYVTGNVPLVGIEDALAEGAELLDRAGLGAGDRLVAVCLIRKAPISR